jgi:hypothetical protein
MRERVYWSRSGKKGDWYTSTGWLGMSAITSISMLCECMGKKKDVGWKDAKPTYRARVASQTEQMADPSQQQHA